MRPPEGCGLDVESSRCPITLACMICGVRSSGTCCIIHYNHAVLVGESIMETPFFFIQVKKKVCENDISAMTCFNFYFYCLRESDLGSRYK